MRNKWMHLFNSVMIMWCHDQKKPNTEVNESHILAPKDLSGLLNPGYHTPRDYNQWVVLNLAFLEKSRFLKWSWKILGLVILMKCHNVVYYLKDSFSRDLCSPSNHQLLLLQPLPQTTCDFGAPLEFLAFRKPQFDFSLWEVFMT